MTAADEADGKAKQTSDAVTADTAAAAGGDGDAGASHHCQSSSIDNKTSSWTSAEVMNWLERNRLQHLTDWSVFFSLCLSVSIGLCCCLSV